MNPPIWTDFVPRPYLAASTPGVEPKIPKEYMGRSEYVDPHAENPNKLQGRMQVLRRDVIKGWRQGQRHVGAEGQGGCASGASRIVSSLYAWESFSIQLPNFPLETLEP